MTTSSYCKSRFSDFFFEAQYAASPRQSYTGMCRRMQMLRINWPEFHRLHKNKPEKKTRWLSFPPLSNVVFVHAFPFEPSGQIVA